MTHTKHLFLYNTLTRKKELFTPLENNTVRMYNCGPTVYNYVHIGNLRAFLFADILRRTLEYNGYDVKQIMNITDVGHLVSDADEGEDKMEKGAAREGKSVKEIADMYTKAFCDDIDHLNIERAKKYPKATAHIKEQIILIRLLEEKEYTYRISDGIYFDTSKVPDYGKLIELDKEGISEGARVEKNIEKKNPTDFALWKFFTKEGVREQEWDSPWGVGFPGWHLECSAMAMKYLGETLDIHTGGIDHAPIHHTNEIAQSEAATGKPLARFWMHSEFVNVESGKMAKSGENFIRLHDLMERGFAPLSYRYWILTAHYKKRIVFTSEALGGAQTALKRLYTLTRELGQEVGVPDPTYQKQFLEKINDDLNTPEALALAWTLLRDAKLDTSVKLATLFDFDRVFGLDLNNAEKYISPPIPHKDLPENVRALVQQRESARVKKDFATADRLRDELTQLGYTVEDTSTGQVIKK